MRYTSGRPRIATWPRDTVFFLSASWRSAKIQRSRILCQTARDPTAINHVQNRDRAAESMSKRCDVPWRVSKISRHNDAFGSTNDKIEFSRTFCAHSFMHLGEISKKKKVFLRFPRPPRRKSGRKRNARLLYLYFFFAISLKKSENAERNFFPLPPPRKVERGEKRISCSLNNKFIARERANSFRNPRLKRSIVLGQVFYSRESSVNKALGGLTSAINWIDPTFHEFCRLSQKSVALEIKSWKN